MATGKAAERGGDHRHQAILADLERATKEEEKVEREVDVNEMSRLCAAHCQGIASTQGMNERKATEEACEFEDGSGQLAEKCQSLCQQADHFRCYK